MNVPYDENDCVVELPVGGYLVMNDGRKLLVGEVNKRGGQCDCCGIYYGDVERIDKPLEQGAGPRAAAGKGE